MPAEAEAEGALLLLGSDNESCKGGNTSTITRLFGQAAKTSLKVSSRQKQTIDPKDCLGVSRSGEGTQIRESYATVITAER